jgi:hypothetical protein
VLLSPSTQQLVIEASDQQTQKEGMMKVLSETMAYYVHSTTKICQQKLAYTTDHPNCVCVCV